MTIVVPGPNAYANAATEKKAVTRNLAEIFWTQYPGHYNQALSKAIADRFHVDARWLVADLADPAAPARIFEKCRAGDRRPGISVVAAGRVVRDRHAAVVAAGRDPGAGGRRQGEERGGGEKRGEGSVLHGGAPYCFTAFQSTFIAPEGGVKTNWSAGR